MNNFTNNKKLRYGTLSAVVTALFLAVIIMFNVVFSTFAQKNLWYIDMTSDGVYTLSDECVDILRDVKDDVRIIFCDDPDTLNDTDNSRLVYNTALEIADKLDNITVETVNVIKNPTAVNKYKTTATTLINPTDVIIESGAKFRKLSLSAFYTFTQSSPNSPWAYSAESKFASTILAVTRTSAPICGIITNHGESYADEALATLVSDAGYEIEFIDLSANEIPTDCKLLISYNPTSDFLSSYDGYSDISEIEKLDKYMDGVNSFILFVSPSTPVLPNLEEYLYEWGVKLGRYEKDGQLYSGMVYDSQNSIDKEGNNIVAKYVTEESSLGLQVNNDLTNAGTAPKVIFPEAMPILHSDSYDSTGYYSSNGYSRQINDIFVAHEDSYVMANGERVDTATKLNTLPLMTITTEGRRVGESKTTEYSYLMVCGSTEFATEALLQSIVYGNSASLYSSMRIMQKDIVVVDLPVKPFSRVAIEGLETSTARNYTLIFTIVPALIVAIIGSVRIVRRKYI